MGKYTQERQLSGIFVRVLRDGEWRNVDFTDLTETEMHVFLGGKSGDYSKVLAVELALIIARMGQEFNITTRSSWDEQ